MRKILAPLLLGIGGFLLTTALLVMLWVPGQVKKTPLDTNNTSRATGDAIYLGGERGPVKGSTHTVVDGKASTGGVVAYRSFTCLVKNPEGTSPDCVTADGADSNLISASTSAFATDRKTALAVKDQEAFVGSDAQPVQGLVNKFPFDVQKKTYPFWDGILGRAIEAKFVGEEKVLDLPTYKFNINVQNQPAEIASGVQGTYSEDKTVWIDPVTGAIQKQVEHQVRTTADGVTALDLNLTMDDQTIKDNVAAAKSNGSKLSLVRKMPWIACLLGLLSTIAGWLLLRFGDAKGTESTEELAAVPSRSQALTTENEPMVAPTSRSETRPLTASGANAAETATSPGVRTAVESSGATAFGTTSAPTELRREVPGPEVPRVDVEKD